MKNKYHKKAFTLVELLVVISIIALLLSILMPSLKKARDQAKKVVCAGNLRQIGVLVSFYANDNNGKLPPLYSNWYPFSSRLSGDTAEGLIVTLPYLFKNGYDMKSSGGMERMKIFWCPSGTFQYSELAWQGTQHANFGYNQYCNNTHYHSPTKTTDPGNWLMYNDMSFEGVPTLENQTWLKSNHHKTIQQGRGSNAWEANACAGSNSLHVGGHVSWYNDSFMNDVDKRFELNIPTGTSIRLVDSYGGKWLYPITQ